MSRPRADRTGFLRNYHSRSDHHSKVACLGIVLDLMRTCGLMQRHAESGRIAFGVNHSMSDFRNRRSKKLDLVVHTPSSGSKDTGRSLASLFEREGVVLEPEEKAALDALPPLKEAPVGGVLLALEAKACMTEHQKALPRLYDELNSSHLTVHGAHAGALACGFLMINAADTFVSPGRNVGRSGDDAVVTPHGQPRATELVVAKARELPRRSSTAEEGYDGFAIVVVDCPNDGSRVHLVEKPPAPARGDDYHYASMIDRVSGLYAVRFSQV
ncbi:hypothetical protein [Salinarimonas ramus]|uniref:Uncharacterized protein n=1 Tax=Salinarimonas ramus TaxID=690164 RepID=A0A917V6X3_9HYPH|nr:hypothetical protein [Salinarimonas ramus]GGK44757.1 hypothetical protein GCM10011322_34900 [Salinarimonas ramus]